MLLAMRQPGRLSDVERSCETTSCRSIIAGHETTAAELAWAFQLLAHNPRVQERVAEEIDGGPVEEYLTATVQEVLRHRPVFLFACPAQSCNRSRSAAGPTVRRCTCSDVPT